MWARLLAVAFAADSGHADGDAWWKTEPCATASCKLDKFPFVVYDSVLKECLCSAHPCLDDNGVRHSCPMSIPYLHFKFDTPGEPGDLTGLKCSCSTEIQVNTLNMERMCGGSECADPDYPIMIVDEKGECACRKHPCTDEIGVQHICDNPEHPVLKFSHTPEGELICECYTAVFGGYDPSLYDKEL